MISCAVLAGELSEAFSLDNGELFRYLNLHSIGSIAGERPHEVAYKIPVHAFGNSRSSFYSIPNGSYVVIRGWVEARPGIGVVVISEIEDLFPKKNDAIIHEIPKKEIAHQS